MTTRQAAIVGLGLIGGSLGGRLGSRGWRVRGYDARREAAETALAQGLVHEIAPAPTDAVTGADAVILAVPTVATLDLLPLLDRVSPTQALLLDTCSVKTPVVDAMAELPGAHRMVGGHPIAGSDRSGPKAADPTLFEGRTFVLCPSSRTSSESLERAQALVREVGSLPRLLDAGDHDVTLAHTSHLPQVLSTVLAVASEALDVELAGTGLRDMTRLAGSDAGMWTEILLANGPQVLSAMDGFRTQFTALMKGIEERDGRCIEHMMRQGNTTARRVREVVSA